MSIKTLSRWIYKGVKVANSGRSSGEKGTKLEPIYKKQSVQPHSYTLTSRKSLIGCPNQICGIIKAHRQHILFRNLAKVGKVAKIDMKLSRCLLKERDPRMLAIKVQPNIVCGKPIGFLRQIEKIGLPK